MLDQHLCWGVAGVGAILVHRDGSCQCGAIDIDQYGDFDHKALAVKIERLKLPLVAHAIEERRCAYLVVPARQGEWGHSPFLAQYGENSVFVELSKPGTEGFAQRLRRTHRVLDSQAMQHEALLQDGEVAVERVERFNPDKS